MAKGNRKDRQEKSIDKPKEYHDVKKDIFKVSPIADAEGFQFQEMFELNKSYAGYIQQFQMHEYALARKTEEIENYRNGKWPSKLIIMLNKQMSRQIEDLAEILEMLEREKTVISQAMDNLRCQMEMKRDEFVECVLRCSSILTQKVGDFEIKELTASRNTGHVYSDIEKARIAKDIEATSVEKLEEEITAKKGKK